MTIAIPILVLLALMAAAGATLGTSTQTGTWPSRRDQPPGWDVVELDAILYIPWETQRPAPINDPSAFRLATRSTLPQAVAFALQITPAANVRVWDGARWTMLSGRGMTPASIMDSLTI